MSVRHAAEVAHETVTAGTKTTRQVLIGPDEGPHFAHAPVRDAARRRDAPHTNTVEHEQYVLAGRATIGIGDRTVEVSRGDVLYIPAGTPHWYKAHEGENFEFLCVVPNGPDKIELVDC